MNSRTYQAKAAKKVVQTISVLPSAVLVQPSASYKLLSRGPKKTLTSQTAALATWKETTTASTSSNTLDTKEFAPEKKSAPRVQVSKNRPNRLLLPLELSGLSVLASRPRPAAKTAATMKLQRLDIILKRLSSTRAIEGNERLNFCIVGNNWCISNQHCCNS